MSSKGNLTLELTGASLSEPHMYGTSMCDLFICMYGTSYDRHQHCAAHTQYIIIHCAHSKIFHAKQAAYCNVCVLHCASMQCIYIAIVTGSSTSAHARAEWRLQAKNLGSLARSTVNSTEQRDIRVSVIGVKDWQLQNKLKRFQATPTECQPA